MIEAQKSLGVDRESKNGEERRIAGNDGGVMLLGECRNSVRQVMGASRSNALNMFCNYVKCSFLQVSGSSFILFSSFFWITIRFFIYQIIYSFFSPHSFPPEP